MTEMKKCLITGCGGFIGSNLADFLLQKGLNVYGFVNNNTEALEELKGSIHIIQQDILDKRGMQSVIKEVRPDYVFHLAALSNIPLSWAEPEKTINTNVIGTLNLLDAIKTADINPVIEITGSSSEYGNSGTSAPLPEHHPLNPS
ncbi:MAG: GDP-mannose 4,6-dehydratase, partial [Dehalococcoidales bacterium]|nr:GDP-mannose 4,6-dehydratase [Dehalococcoidales bacterium]